MDVFTFTYKLYDKLSWTIEIVKTQILSWNSQRSCVKQPVVGACCRTDMLWCNESQPVVGICQLDFWQFIPAKLPDAPDKPWLVKNKLITNRILNIQRSARIVASPEYKTYFLAMVVGYWWLLVAECFLNITRILWSQLSVGGNKRNGCLQTWKNNNLRNKYYIIQILLR